MCFRVHYRILDLRMICQMFFKVVWSRRSKLKHNSIQTLKGHCHSDFAIFSSKWLKYLTKNLFSYMKLLLEHREGNIKVFIRGRTNYKQFLTTSLQYTVQYTSSLLFADLTGNIFGRTISTPILIVIAIHSSCNIHHPT